MKKGIGALCLLLGVWFTGDLSLMNGRDGSVFSRSFSLCLAAEETPFAEVYEFSHDLGKIRLDETYEYSFAIRNSGTGMLEIKNVVVG